MEGVFVPKVSNIKFENVHLAVGFVPEMNTNLDDALPKSNHIYTDGFGKLYSKGNTEAGVKIYKTTDHSIFESLMKVSLPTELSSFRFINTPNTSEKLIVKVTPIFNNRGLMTSHKEVMMNHRIFASSKNGVNGSDYVCEPFLGTPVYTRSGWCFVFVSSYCKGYTVATLLSSFQRLLKGVNYSKMYDDIAHACDAFWTLGFAHNDLHPGNIMYNPKTRFVTFIDLETAVEVEPYVNDAYINCKLAGDVVCHINFEKVMLPNALNLLRYSENWLNQFTTMDHNQPMLFNTDCYLLHALSP
jgi:serine/threonine protein kinase